VRQDAGEAHGLREEIDLDAILDFDWQKELKTEAKKILERELTGSGDETEVDAREMVENLIDEELE
jgi:hypothetical protein